MHVVAIESASAPKAITPRHTQSQCESRYEIHLMSTNQISLADFEAKRIAERFWREHQSNPVAKKAVELLSKRRAPAGNGDAIT